MRLIGRLKREWQFHLMLVPAVIVTLLFEYQALYGVVIAFQKYNPAMGFNSPWVGLKHFRTLFAQPNFVRTIWNSLYIATFKLVGGILVAVIFALLLNEINNKYAKKTIQTLVYLPNFISWVILAGILNNLLSSTGIVNRLIMAIGLDKVGFLGDPNVFPWTMIISDIWKGFGFDSIVYLAALTSIDPELYEAAKIDGAKRIKQVRYITLPMLAPTIVLMATLSLGSILSAGFDQVYNLYSPIVYSTGDILDTYTYRMGIEMTQYSIGAAVGLFKSAVSTVLILISHYLADKLAGYRVL